MQIHSKRLQYIHIMKIRYANFSCHEFPFHLFNFIYKSKKHFTAELN